MFNTLLNKVCSKIEKNYTVMREPISAKLKLQIACRYLATGDSLGSLQYLYRVPKCTISQFLPYVFDAIYEVLKEYVMIPKTENDWKKIINGFETCWNFPQCIGAIDGKHVLIQCPPNSGSQYFNYKRTFSIVLLALVDHNYNFIFIDIGSYGSISDGSIFAKSSLHQALERNILNQPDGSVILGDEAFPLKPYLMKPYPRRNQLSIAQKVFNYRQCRARRVVENAFGIMSSRFRIFRSPILLAPTTVVKLIKATCALHNWIRKVGNEVTVTADIEDHVTGRIIPGNWRNVPRQNGLADVRAALQRNYLPEARQKREDLTNYFTGPGALDWQYKMIE
ncbi:protein ALP1-like [Sitophilus oryzae]|nr:protein ALP1-like [Sitophilus oryzae]